MHGVAREPELLRVEELEGILHSMAADVAGTDDVLQRVRPPPRGRPSWRNESKVVEQLNTTLHSVKPGRNMLSSEPRRSFARSLTGFKSYSRLTRFIVAIKSFMAESGDARSSSRSKPTTTVLRSTSRPLPVAFSNLGVARLSSWRAPSTAHKVLREVMSGRAR